jgi:hypothetical protein
MYQFSLGRFLIVITAIALYFGLAFAAPPIIGAPILYFVLTASPALWIAGIVYARGREQAFFLGGTVAGSALWCIVFYWYTMLAFSLDSGGRLGDLWIPAIKTELFLVNAAFLAPGIASFIGGMTSMVVYGIFVPKHAALRTSAQSEDRPC